MAAVEPKAGVDPKGTDHKLTIVELVRPAGRLLLVPAVAPPPLPRPWQVLQAVTPVE